MYLNNSAISLSRAILYINGLFDVAFCYLQRHIVDLTCMTATSTKKAAALRNLIFHNPFLVLQLKTRRFDNSRGF